MMRRGGNMLLSIGVVVMCVGLAAGIIRVVLPRLSSPTPLGVFLRLVSVSGALSVGAGAMYVVRFSGGGTGALVTADTAMVLASALVCVAVWPPGNGRSVSPIAFASALCLAALTGLSSALLPLATSLAVKAGVLTLVSAAGAVLTLRNRELPRASMCVLGATMCTYGAYSALRLVVAATPESPLSRSVFSPTGTGIAAVAAMLMTGVAVGLVGRPVAHAEVRDDHRRILVSIGDWRLATAAFGTDRVLGLLLELRLAARELDSSAVDGVHGVEVALPDALASLRERMRMTYGWRPEEIELLIDRSPTPRGLPRYRPRRAP